MFKTIRDGRLAQEWIAVGLTRGPRVSTEDVRAFFRYLRVPLRFVIWAPDAICAGRTCRLANAGVDLSAWDGREVSESWVEAQLATVDCPPLDPDEAFSCQLNADWMADALAFEGLDLDLSPARIYEPLVRGAGQSFYARGVCILSPRVAPSLDARGLLHNTTGPAIHGRIYALHGLILPPEYEWIVTESERLNRDSIDGIDDDQVRRMTIATFPEKYISGEPDQFDAYGELFRIRDARMGSQLLCVVRVKDPTSAQHHWLVVPPHVTTAHEGVAASFGMTPAQYQPEVQT